ncbi:hypothetical protein SGCOL_005848 [Colletotrichum sp. CLE4]
MPTRYESSPASPEPLARPLTFPFSGKTAKNRLLKSAMAESLATWSPTEPSKRGIPTTELVEVYRRWGQGPDNFGIISTGNITIDFEHVSTPGDMIITPECAPTEGDARFEGFKAIAAAGKADGSLMIGQVNHGGRQVQKKIQPNPVSASAVPLEPKMGMEFAPPREATKQDIARFIDGFAHAATYLEKAGFDGIQLHAAHGYLIAQFLSRTTNRRTDEYGPQTLENRTRLIAEIGKAVKQRTSAGFILSAKINSVEFQEGGVTSDEAREMSALLSGLGFDFFGDFGGYGLGEDAAARKTKAYIVGGMRTVGAMVEALEVVDGVGLGRPGAQEFRFASELISGKVQGAVQPVEMIEKDIGMGLTTAGAHIHQVGRGEEPFDASDEGSVGRFVQDMQAWYGDLVADGDKLEHYGAVKFSGETVPYGETSKA